MPTTSTVADDRAARPLPPAGCIDPNRIAPAIAADPRWYGFRWNGKGTPPNFFSFPNADEVTYEPGEPCAIIPALDKGSSFDVAYAALLNGTEMDGIAMLAPGAKRPELFNGRDGWILWTKESTATEQEKAALLDSLGFYDEEIRTILVEQGMLPKPPAGNGQVADSEPAESDRPIIDAIPGHLHIVVRQAEEALLAADVPVYQRIGMLVRPATLPTEVKAGGTTLQAGTLVIEPVNKAWLAERFNQVATWRKYNERKRTMVQTDCPARYAEHYLAKKGEWNVPVLTGIVEAPLLRRDGSLLSEPGYDPQSGLYLNYSGPAVEVPDRPTREDALRAIEVIKEPFEEFPFVSEVDRSVALSGLLTVVNRRSMKTAPYHAADAPEAGSGKGLLIDTCALVATGRPATTSTLGADEAETEKRLGALLMRGVSIINLDNAARPVEGDFICSLATQETVDPRILGQSATATIPTNTAAVFLTGNNLVFKGDMTRRVLVSRIDPRCERPDARQFKRNLRQFVTENRHRLLSAALTVLRAYVCAGKPIHGKAPYGSFEEWDALIRGALLWLDQPDPLESRERIVSHDPTATGLRALLETWFEVFSTRAVTVHEVVAEATSSNATGQYSHPKGEELRHALIEVASNRDGISINPRGLSHYLRKNRDKVAGPYRLEEAGTYGKYALWKLGITGISGISSTPRENFRSEKGVEEAKRGVDSAKNIVVTKVNAANAANTTNGADRVPTVEVSAPPDPTNDPNYWIGLEVAPPPVHTVTDEPALHAKYCSDCQRYYPRSLNCGALPGVAIEDNTKPPCIGRFFRAMEDGERHG